MKTKRNRSSFILVLIAVLLMVPILAACSSATVEETKVSETVEVKEEVVEVEVAEAEPTTEPTPEPTAEPTPEPTPEAVVYEGIDMQSELPVGEWTMTFLGVIEEPKFVIANDATNKKVILEEGEEVQLEEGDVVGLYDPQGDKDKRKYSYIVSGGNYIHDYYQEFTFWEEIFTKKTLLEVIIDTNDGEKHLTCTLIPY